MRPAITPGTVRLFRACLTLVGGWFTVTCGLMLLALVAAVVTGKPLNLDACLGVPLGGTGLFAGVMTLRKRLWAVAILLGGTLFWTVATTIGHLPIDRGDTGWFVFVVLHAAVVTVLSVAGIVLGLRIDRAGHPLDVRPGEIEPQPSAARTAVRRR